MTRALLLATIFAPSLAFAQTPATTSTLQLPAAITVSPTDNVQVTQGGVTKKATIATVIGGVAPLLSNNLADLPNVGAAVANLGLNTWIANVGTVQSALQGEISRAKQAEATIAASGGSGGVQPSQVITATGDVTGGGTLGSGSFTLVLPPVTTAGTGPRITYDAKGRVLSSAGLLASDVTAAGGALASQALNVTGDVTGAGTLASGLTVTLPTIATPGTFPKVTVDAKGRVTSGSALVSSDLTSAGGLLSSAVPASTGGILGNSAAGTLGTIPLTGGLTISGGALTPPRSALNATVVGGGALLDGTTADQTRLQAAYAAIPNGGIVEVPPGKFPQGFDYYHAFQVTPDHTKSVLWNFKGNVDLGNGTTPGTRPFYNEGDGDVVEQFINGSKTFSKQVLTGTVSSATAAIVLDLKSPSYNFVGNYKDLPALQLTASDYAGSTGEVNGVKVTINSGGNNGFIGEDQGVNIGVNRNGTNGTWAYNSATFDWTGLPPGAFAAVGTEMDIYGNGPDDPASLYDPTKGNRIMEFLAPKVMANFNGNNVTWAATTGYQTPAFNQATGANNGQPTVIIASSITGVQRTYIATTAGTSGSTQPVWPDSGTVTDGSVVWTEGTTVPMSVGRGVWLDGCRASVFHAATNCKWGNLISSDAAIQGAGLDLSFATMDSSGAAAIRLGQDLPFDWTGNGTQAGQNLHVTVYSSAASAFQYKVGGSPVMSIADTGKTTLFALNVAPSTPASATAACVAGDVKSDASFTDVCTATNTWRSTPLGAFQSAAAGAVSPATTSTLGGVIAPSSGPLTVAGNGALALAVGTATGTVADGGVVAGNTAAITSNTTAITTEATTARVNETASFLVPRKQTLIPAVHLAKLAASATPTVCLIGDSTSSINANNITKEDLLQTLLSVRLREDNPTKTITYKNFAVAGTSWLNFLTNTPPQATPFYLNSNVNWYAYVQAAGCDSIFTNWGVNDQANIRLTTIQAAIANIVGWGTAPATRANSTAYGAGTVALNAAGVMIYTVSGGTTAASPPTFAALNGSTTDGTVTWITMGAAAYVPKVPDLVLITNKSANPDAGSPYNTEPNVDGYYDAASLQRTIALSNTRAGVAGAPPIGLIDNGRQFTQVVRGFDPTYEVMTQQIAPAAPVTVPPTTSTYYALPATAGDFDLTFTVTTTGSIASTSISTAIGCYESVLNGMHCPINSYILFNALSAFNSAVNVYPEQDVTPTVFSQTGSLVNTPTTYTIEEAIKGEHLTVYLNTNLIVDTMIPRFAGAFIPEIRFTTLPASVTGIQITNYVTGSYQTFTPLLTNAQCYGLASGLGTQGGNGVNHDASACLQAVDRPVFEATRFAP